MLYSKCAFIRANPPYDLAHKMDDLFVKYIRINQDQEFNYYLVQIV